MKKDHLKERCFQLSIVIIELYKELIASNEYVISKQILKSATSIGANLEEGLVAFSLKEFIYRFSLSYKELKETIYWLKLLHLTNYIDKTKYEKIFRLTDEIGALLFTSIKKLKQKVPK